MLVLLPPELLQHALMALISDRSHTLAANAPAGALRRALFVCTRADGDLCSRELAQICDNRLGYNELCA